MRKSILSFCLCVVFCFSLLLQGCGNGKVVVFQNIDYSESVRAISNPDCGFYQPLYVTFLEDGIDYYEDVINGSASLYHLRIDIGVFSANASGSEDKEISNVALSGFEDLLKYLYQENKTAIIRFAYDGFDGIADQEPSIQMVMTHVVQVCEIMEKYSQVITAVEAGFFGKYGEMHTSEICTTENFNLLISTFLNNTETLPILVRKPSMIYNYLGISIDDLENYTISSDNPAYRLSVFNDGYLGSSTDLGTYSSGTREQVIAWLKSQTNHLPYGGEVVVPGSDLHNIENCLDEMFEINLSYLNKQWNDEVIEKWKTTYYTEACGNDSVYYGQTAYTYIENHMGYRLLLTSSTFTYDKSYKNLQIDLEITNKGFGQMNKSKQLQLIFVDENGEVAKRENVGTYLNGTSISISADLNLSAGTYEVYLRLSDNIEEDAKYYIEFANNNIFNDTIKANKIGSITIG